MAAKKGNTANDSKNTATVDEGTDFTDTQHGETANYCNNNTYPCFYNFTCINPVPESAVFHDMTPCTFTEYLNTQYHI
jgi:hypothetical protein